MSSRRPRILVVGSNNMDLVIRCPRLPAAGETLFGRDFATIPGGKGGNQAVAAARLGAEAFMVGRVGADPFGEQLVADLERSGVNTRYVVRDNAAASGVALILVQETGQNSIVVAPGANGRCAPEDIDALGAELASFDALLVQLEIPIATVEHALARARAAGVLTVLDAGPARELPPSLYQHVDIISPNESEATALTGIEVRDEQSARRAAEELLARGARSAVMKLGEHGALVVEEGRAEHVPGFSVEVVDTTAAGDAFTAALAVALAEGLSLVEATRWANGAGALAVTVHGAKPAMPTRAAVEQFLRERGAKS